MISSKVDRDRGSSSSIGQSIARRQSRCFPRGRSNRRRCCSRVRRIARGCRVPGRRRGEIGNGERVRVEQTSRMKEEATIARAVISEASSSLGRLHHRRCPFSLPLSAIGWTGRITYQRTVGQATKQWPEFGAKSGPEVRVDPLWSGK